VELIQSDTEQAEIDRDHPDTEMVERVARAMDLAIQADHDYGMDVEALTIMARAAIEAMREPTDEMRAAAIQDIDDDPGYGMHEVMGAWRAMISAALGEKS